MSWHMTWEVRALLVFLAVAAPVLLWAALWIKKK